MDPEIGSCEPTLIVSFIQNWKTLKILTKELCSIVGQTPILFGTPGTSFQFDWWCADVVWAHNMLLLTNCDVHTGKYLDRSSEVPTE